MTIVSYVMETSSISGTGSYELDGASGDFRTFLSALQAEHGASPMPSSWDDVQYTAYTLDVDNEYDEVEVGSGTLTDGTSTSPVTGDMLSRADVDVSYSTNSNNRVSWPAGATIYVVCSLNSADLTNA